MRNTYIVGAILFVAIVSGALIWKLLQQKDQPVVKAPELVQVIHTPTNTLIPTRPPVEEKVIEETVTPKPMTKTYTKVPAMAIDAKKTYSATLVTNKGTMTVMLYAKDAPVTVNNFVFLSREGFYANTIFHRIMKGFMIQGGDPLGTGTGGPGYKFADEPVTREYSRGTIAMANSGPNTNGSQFFIMHATNGIPKQYVIFGAIDPSDTKSLATLDAIASSPVTDNGMGEDSKPVDPPVVQSISIKEE